MLSFAHHALALCSSHAHGSVSSSVSLIAHLAFAQRAKLKPFACRIADSEYV
jgi:hypothetical protein